jgi:outer membrane protein assembly factor BamB
MLMTMLVTLMTASVLQAGDWPYYRGAGPADLPTALPKGEWKPLWTAKMSGECHAGIAVAEGVAVVADHGDGKDIYRAHDAVTGKELWKKDFENKDESNMDYGPAPRATPLIIKGKVVVVGAYGDVHGLDLKTGKELWSKSYSKDYEASDPGMWGFCTSPIAAGGNAILFPMNLVAVNPDNGNTVWKTETSGQTYSTPIVGKFGGVEQIVGFDSGKLNGWDSKTGKKIWSIGVTPGPNGIVGSPSALNGKVVFSIEGEGTKMFTFGDDGKAIKEAAGANDGLAPDTYSSGTVGDFVLGPSGGLICLDGTDKLKELWLNDKDDVLSGAAHIIGGKDSALIFSNSGGVALIKVKKDGPEVLGSRSLYGGGFSFPAVANGRLYVRDRGKLSCYDFSGKAGESGGGNAGGGEE